jgi:hypothetical protein
MSENTILPIVFLAFGAVVVVGEIVILVRRQQGFGPQAVRIVGITIIVTIAAGLAAASNIPLERLTAVIGLLGTLAGYLAGRGENKTEG